MHIIAHTWSAYAETVQLYGPGCLHGLNNSTRTKIEYTDQKLVQAWQLGEIMHYLQLLFLALNAAFITVLHAI